MMVNYYDFQQTVLNIPKTKSTGIGSNDFSFGAQKA